MDLSKKMFSPTSGGSDSQRKSPKTAMKISHESKENSFSANKTSTSVTPILKNETKSLKIPSTSPSSQNRILKEKSNLSNSFKKISPQKKTPKTVPVSTNASRPDSPYPFPYDPVTNYTSPRPEFLRYDPNRRMEIMLRIEKAMLDEEEGSSPSTSSASTSPQVHVKNAIPEGEPSPSNSSISTSLQVQVPVCGEEKCKTDEEGDEGISYAKTTEKLSPQVLVCGEEKCQSDDDEEEEEVGTSYAKMALKLIFLLVCLLSSVYICSLSPNMEMKLHARTSEVDVLSEMIGLSKMCLSRRNADFTCGVEEREEATIEVIPKKFDVIGFTFEEEEMFDGSESEVRKETEGTRADIGLWVQENTVEIPEVELHAEGDTQIQSPEMELHTEGENQILESSMKVQVYLLYSVLALVFFSGLVAFVISVCKNIGMKFCKKKNRNQAKEILATGTYEKRGSGPGQKSIDETSIRIGGKSNMFVVQPPEVELLGEFSLNGPSMVMESPVMEVEVQAKKVYEVIKDKGSPNKELELQANPIEPTTPGAFLEKIRKEENINRREATKSGLTPVRRSSRLKSRVTSPLA